MSTSTRESPVAARLLSEGQQLEDNGELELALDCYRDAVTASPDAPRPHMNMANVLQKVGRTAEALAAARAAVRCDPSYAPARFNLGQTLVTRGELALAESELEEALRLMPNLVEARVVIADVRDLQGDHAGCERELRTTLAQHPHHRGAAFNLLQLMLRQHRYDDVDSWLFREMANNRNFAVTVLTDILASLNQSAVADNQAIYETHRWFGRFIEQSAKPAFDPFLNPSDPDRRLRIGYVSGDFREHPIARFMQPVLEHHDHARFEAFCYSTFGGSNERARALQPLVSRWNDVSSLSDSAFAELIHDEQIDILVDLSGHTAHNRLSTFALRPAPVQVTWLGYLNTTGLSAMDWRICDRHTDPVGETDRFHVERLFRMPASQWCYQPWRETPRVSDPRISRSHGLMFGSFNQHDRISDMCLGLWCELLRRLPHARIKLLDVRDHPTGGGLVQRFSQRGIDLGRLEMHGRLALDEYFAAIADVDIALDTTPYSGATTALNALWMGVPVVGLRGTHSLSRGCFSVLRTLGLPELTTESTDEYVAINVRLANDEQRRHHLRSTLRERMRNSPLMDAPAFVSALEAGYRMMWRAWCESLRVDHATK